MPKQIIPDNPSVGISIGTFAAVPYIHLQLECIKRFNPNVKVLVHDDCSHHEAELRQLASEYGADFATPTSHRNPTVGDLSSFTEGLKWGREKGLDIVLKCSRRYVIARPWDESLRDVFVGLQYPTVCAPCAWFSFGFRSELVGMHVSSWIDSGAMVRMQGYVERNQQIDPLPEAGIHREAVKVFEHVHRSGASLVDPQYVHTEDADFTLRSEAIYNRPGNYNGYGWWPLMGLHRLQVLPRIIWHDQDGHEKRCEELSKEFGFKYVALDFLNPNV